VIGKVGTMLGDARVNIAGAQVARKGAGGSALMAVTTDTHIPFDVLERITTEIGAERVRQITLPE
jgi:D-3-phosphoglycerate dehydrogenase